MTQDAEQSYVDQLGEKPLVRVVAYYVALAAVVVQTLLILPVVVTGIIGIVRYSTALAFGLAGVVAAARWSWRGKQWT